MMNLLGGTVDRELGRRQRWFEGEAVARLDAAPIPRKVEDDASTSLAKTERSPSAKCWLGVCTRDVRCVRPHSYRALCVELQSVGLFHCQSSAQRNRTPGLKG